MSIALSSVYTKSMLRSIEHAFSCNENNRNFSVALDSLWQKKRGPYIYEIVWLQPHHWITGKV